MNFTIIYRIISILILILTPSLNYVIKCGYYTTRPEENENHLTCQAVNVEIPEELDNLEFDLGDANATDINGLDLVTGNHGFTSFPNKMFMIFPYIEYVYLKSNIQVFLPNNFQNATKVKDLNLKSNNVTYVALNTFSALNELRTLTLDSNQLANIEPGAFNGLHKLQILSLKSNQLNILRNGTFVGINNLDQLFLNENRIHVIEDGGFDLPKLRFLGLSGNKLITISDSVFCKLPNLYSLGLGANKLNHIGVALYELQNIRYLFLDNNRIEDIDMTKFASLPRLKFLFLNNSGFSFKPQQQRTNETMDNIALKYLSLSNNNLTNPGDLQQLGFLKGLEILELDGNMYTDFDLNSIKFEGLFPNLKTLNLKETNINCENLKMITKQLEEGSTSIKVKFDGQICK